MKYEEMEAEDNVSTVIQLVLLGFSDRPNLQGLLFGGVLHHLHHYLNWK